MSSEVTVEMDCAVEGVASVIVRHAEPLIGSVSIEDGCAVEVHLGADDTETWSQKTGTWESA